MSPTLAPHEPSTRRVPSSVLVVGGGLAGFTVAQELRRLGYEGALTLVDPEGLPYDRPPLSKEYLDGRQPAERLLLADASWYEENLVQVVTDRVASIDTRAGRGVGAGPGPKHSDGGTGGGLSTSEGPVTVTLEGGDRLRVDTLVLAVGGQPRRLPVPGGDHPDVRYLRTKGDADRLRAVLAPGHRLLVVGAGLIGAEVAATAVAAGAEVTLLDPVAVPAEAALGRHVAVYLHGLHAEHGVVAVTATPTAVARDGDEWVVTAEGDSGVREYRADTLLGAVGMVPDVRLAQQARLDVDGGVLVDAQQRTSDPRVFAVGDVARRRLPDGTLTQRHEHWDSASQDARVAAAAILGREAPQRSAPWMWTDRYGRYVQATGSMREGRVVIRGSEEKPSVVFTVSDDGRLLGAASINDPRAIRAARQIIDKGRTVDPAQLADPSVNLKTLAR